MQLIETKTPHAFTVAEFMSLDTETRTELLAGVVYDVSPRNEPHRLAVRNRGGALSRVLFGLSFEVQVQDAVAVPGWRGRDAPEIDVAVIAANVGAGVPSWIVNVALRQVECYETLDDLELTHGRVLHEGETLTILGVTIAVSDLFEQPDPASEDGLRLASDARSGGGCDLVF